MEDFNMSKRLFPVRRRVLKLRKRFFSDLSTTELMDFRCKHSQAGSSPPHSQYPRDHYARKLSSKSTFSKNVLDFEQSFPTRLSILPSACLEELFEVFFRKSLPIDNFSKVQCNRCGLRAKNFGRVVELHSICGKERFKKIYFWKKITIFFWTLGKFFGLWAENFGPMMSKLHTTSPEKDWKTVVFVFKHFSFLG